jgi:hypothetical protein
MEPTDTFTYRFPDGPKLVRETLCAAQASILHSTMTREQKQRHQAMLQRMINQCDVMRPLGSNGKHGDLHTDRCGCDEEDRQNCPRPTKVPEGQ